MRSLDLDVNIDELHKLNKFIEDIIQKKDFQIDLIIEEVFANIVSYSETDFIRVNAEFVDSTLTVEFIDNGIEFNPLLKEDPKTPDNIEDAEIGGVGIVLIKKMADELDYHYLNGENHLKIVKKVE